MGASAPVGCWASLSRRFAWNTGRLLERIQLRDTVRGRPGAGSARADLDGIAAHDASPHVLMYSVQPFCRGTGPATAMARREIHRSEEHTSELQSHVNLVCRLLLEKKKKCSIVV